MCLAWRAGGALKSVSLSTAQLMQMTGLCRTSVIGAKTWLRKNYYIGPSGESKGGAKSIINLTVPPAPAANDNRSQYDRSTGHNTTGHNTTGHNTTGDPKQGYNKPNNLDDGPEYLTKQQQQPNDDVVDAGFLNQAVNSVLRAANGRLHQSVAGPGGLAESTIEVRHWISAGYDLERDILPAIKQVCSGSHAEDVRKVKYFRPIIENHVQGCRKAVADCMTPKSEARDAKFAATLKGVL